MHVHFTKIPTFDCATETWSYTEFESQEAFAEFLDSLWSDDCDYQFDEDSLYFNEKGRFFAENGYYTAFARKTKERKEFWKKEGEKCVRGAIIKGRKRTWYLTRDYYFALNYCLIANKERGDDDTFLDVRDIQYHLSLYLKRAEAHNKHAILTKKRQMASSLIHCAKLLNKYWFDRNAVNKVFAADGAFINTEDGIWKFFNKYRDFLNEHTDWYRNNLPNEEFSWMQRIEVTVNGRKMYKGRKSILSGITLQQKPKKGVGGACAYGYHEEAGMAPKLDETYQFFRPATESGIYTTGMFIAAGSVGDLKQCEPLKRYMYSPTSNRFLATENKWATKERIPTPTGLFIPEQWGMPGYIDKYGNSLITDAFEHLKEHYERLKKDPKVSPRDYQYEISQHPLFLDDAFRHNTVSYFPADLLGVQQERIELKDKDNRWEYKPQKGLLSEDINGRLVLKPTEAPEHGYPIKPEWPDKRGCVTIYEQPESEQPKWWTYFAGVDNIESDVTDSSESVMAVYIFKNVVKVLYTDEKTGQIRTRFEGDKLVASYVGRFDSADKTNEQAWFLIKMYNAFTFAERSKPNFVNYMMRYGRAEKYLAKESDVPMFKDINDNVLSGSSSKYGFVIPPNRETASNQIWRMLKSYFKEYLLAEYGFLYEEGTDKILRPLRGVDRIDDYWLCEELIQFNDSGNFDRFIGAAAAILIAKVHQQNQYIIQRDETKPKKPDRPKQPKVVNLLGGSYRVKTWQQLQKEQQQKQQNNQRKKKPFSLL